MNQLFGWSAQQWLYIDQSLTVISVVLSIVGPIIAYVYRENIRTWLHARAYRISEKPLQHFNYEGLVLTFSNQDLALWQVQSIQPKYCAILTTDDIQERGGYAELERYCGANNIVFYSLIIKNKDSVDDVKARAKSCVDFLRTDGCDHMAIDMTGGTKPMGVGAFVAAIEMGVDCLYTRSKIKNKKLEPTSIVTVTDQAKQD